MKKIVFLLLFFIPIAQTAEPVVFRSKMLLKSDEGSLFDSLSFGTDIMATDCIDESIGESDLPTIYPFSYGGVFRLYCIKENETEPDNHWTYQDYRNVINAPGDSLVYLFDIYQTNVSNELKWDAFGPEFDSVFLTDLGGFAFKLDMKSKTDTTVDALFRKFKIKVYPKYDYSGVEDEQSARVGVTIRNYGENEYEFESVDIIRRYYVYSTTGILAFSTEILSSSGRIPTDALPMGAYYAVFETINGARIIKNILKY